MIRMLYDLLPKQLKNSYTIFEDIIEYLAYRERVSSDKFVSKIKDYEDLHAVVSEVLVNGATRNWSDVIEHFDMNEDFIVEFMDSLDSYTSNEHVWRLVGGVKGLSDEFIDNYFDRIGKGDLFNNYKIDESILRKHASSFNENTWKSVSKTQKLSEDFIHTFRKKLYWNWISLYQSMSEEFMMDRQHIGLLNFFNLGDNHAMKVSKEFIDKLKKILKEQREAMFGK
jgi:hypothetical protein